MKAPQCDNCGSMDIEINSGRSYSSIQTADEAICRTCGASGTILTEVAPHSTYRVDVWTEGDISLVSRPDVYRH